MTNLRVYAMGVFAAARGICTDIIIIATLGAYSLMAAVRLYDHLAHILLPRPLMQWCLNGAARVCTEKFYARHPLIIPFPRNDLMRHYICRRIKLGRATVLKFCSQHRYAINF
jgi:hypothetical protein